MDTTAKKVQILKISDLLLNRVKNIQWYYFDMNFDQLGAQERLSAPPPESAENPITPLLDKITGANTGHFVYQLPPGAAQAYTLNSADLLGLIEYLRRDPEIMTEVMSRIFDMNNILQDGSAVETAQNAAVAGLLKPFNAREKRVRDKKFKEKLRKQPDFRNRSENIVALAEGDSWFCFPKIHLPGFRWAFTDAVRDIIDHLIDRKEYAVFSLAAGGDWLNNMLDDRRQEYVENLSKVMPDVFLVSGGGNDLAVDGRIAHMVRAIHMEGRRDLITAGDALSARLRNDLLPRRLQQQRPRPIDEAQYRRGMELISDNFIRFINICMVQYFALFYRLLVKSDKFKGMMILTHGYDFAIPSKQRSGWFWTWKRILNSDFAMNSGKWLYDPMCVRGVSDPEDQRAAVYVMIYEFNEMMCQLAQFSWFKNVFHIDARGVAAQPDHWFDELHLKSAAYKKIADAYHRCIVRHKTAFQTYSLTGKTPDLSPQDKVIRVVD